MIPWTGVDGRDYLCNHADHNGRPKSSVLGEAPATSRWFSYRDLEGHSAP